MLVPRSGPKGFLDLNPDILSYIFLQLVQGDSEAPLKLTHINRHLRHLVHSMGPIWAIVDINYGSSCAMLHLLLSGNAPLTIRMNLGPTRTPPDGPTRINAFISILLPHIARISVLEIIPYLPEWASLASSLLLEGLPRLRSLDLGVTRPHEVKDPHLWTMMCRIPRGITTLRLKRIDPSLIHVVSSITNLELHGCHLKPFRLTTKLLSHLTRKTRNLVSLVLEGIHIVGADSMLVADGEPPSPWTLPKLKDLTFRNCPSDGIAAFVDIVEMPQLLNFEVRFDEPSDFSDHQGDPDQVRILKTIGRNCPHLQHLGVIDHVLSNEEWVDVFLELDELVSLKVSRGTKSSDCLQFLLEFPTGHSTEYFNYACPKLEELSLVDYASVHVFDTVRQIVLKRAQSPHPLRAVNLGSWHTDDVDQSKFDTIRKHVKNVILKWYSGEDGAESDRCDDGYEGHR